MISLQESPYTPSGARPDHIPPLAPGTPAAKLAATALLLAHVDGEAHRAAVMAIIYRLSAATSEIETILPQSVEAGFAGWDEHELEIKSITAALMDAADEVGSLPSALAAALCEALPNLLTPDMIQRVIRAGLEAESEDFLDLLDCVRPPTGPEPLTTREESMARLLDEIRTGLEAGIAFAEEAFPGVSVPGDTPVRSTIRKIGKVLAAVKGDAPHA